VAPKLDPAKPASFMAAYEKLLNLLGAAEAVLFGDTVQMLHALRRMGCWARKESRHRGAANQRPGPPQCARLPAPTMCLSGAAGCGMINPRDDPAEAVDGRPRR
jgi:hypothetical protein